MKEHLQFVKSILAKTEFTKSDCEVFEKWLQQIADEISCKKLSHDAMFDFLGQNQVIKMQNRMS